MHFKRELPLAQHDYHCQFATPIKIKLVPVVAILSTTSYDYKS